MATLHQYRILIEAPVAKVAAVAGWLAANIDANADPNLGPGLNVSGLLIDPVTFRWMSGAFQSDEARRILVKLCQLAAVATPSLATWNGWTKAERINWLLSVQAAIFAGYGAWVTMCANDGAWDDPAAALAAIGMKVAV